MSDASPRPWRTEHNRVNGNTMLVNANGISIGAAWQPENAALIVDAVNQYEWANEEIHRLNVEKDAMFDEAVEIRDERDHLRDIVRRLIEYADAVAGYRHRTIEVLSSDHPARTFDGAAIIREARKTIRKKKK